MTIRPGQHWTRDATSLIVLRIIDDQRPPLVQYRYAGDPISAGTSRISIEDFRRWAAKANLDNAHLLPPVGL